MHTKDSKLIWTGGVVIVLVVGAYFVGQSSSQPSQTAPANSATAGNSTMSADEVFADKTKCEGYLDKLQQNSLNSSVEIDVVYKIFYSQSLNTCLSEQYNLYPAHGTVTEGEVLLINDVLTGGNIWTSQVYTPELKYWDAESKLDQQAEQYQ